MALFLVSLLLSIASVISTIRITILERKVMRLERAARLNRPPPIR